jgi:hypothetical protein
VTHLPPLNARKSNNEQTLTQMMRHPDRKVFTSNNRNGNLEPVTSEKPSAD